MALPKSSVLADRIANEPAKDDTAGILERQQILDAKRLQEEDAKAFPYKVECFNEWVAVIPLAAPTETSGGIAIVESERATYDIGLVVGFGPEAKKYFPIDILGKCVKFGSNGKIEVTPGDIAGYENYELILVLGKNIMCLTSHKLNATFGEYRPNA